uniref:MFS transporter n=1 Tax=Cyberlindnera americana TaxID=36016 RepID=A0A5P8N8T6_9ASCO|nr:MFS transporter [Cyberlindnera americana]
MEVQKTDQDVRIVSVTSEKLIAVDEGFHIASELQEEEFHLVPEKERRLVRKIDLYIIPMMCALMSCLLMDKSTNSYASIMGLRKDLGMSTRTYSWAGSTYYLAYLICEYPANLILQKLPLGRVLAFAVIMWGIIVCLHATSFNSTGFLVCRAALGVFESFMHPSFMIVTSQWYKKDEQFIRSAYWLGFQGFGTMVGSGIAYGIYHNQDTYSIASWKLLYIITGSITIGFGILTLWFPSSPATAWFLTEDEKKMCILRVQNNRTGLGNKQFKWNQALEALYDPCLYLYFFYMFGYGISNGALGTFGGILFDDKFEFSVGESLLLNMPGSGIDIVFPLLFAYLAKYVVKSRLAVSAFINIGNLIGLCLLAFCLNNRYAMMVGYYLNYWCTAGWACMSSMITSNVAGHSKKVVFNTLFLIGFSAGNIVGPQTYIESEAPVYSSSAYAMVGTAVMQTIAPIALYFIYFYRNKTKSNDVQDLCDDLTLSFGDITDMKNPKFQYVL